MSFDNPYAMIGLIALAIAWVIVTIINRMCHHEWEKDGKPVRWKITSDNGEKFDEYRAPVRCVKCGKHSWFKAAGSE